MSKSNWKGTSGWSSVTDPTGVLNGKVLVTNAGLNSRIEDYLEQIPNTSTTFSENHYSVIINYAFPKSNGIHPMSNGKFGLVARAGNFQDGNTIAQNCYIAVADLENGVISISRRVSGTETLLIEADIPNDAISKGVKHVMEFRCYGTTTVTLQFYIDNTLFISHGDNSSSLISSGISGISVSSGTVYIDNFTVIKYTSTGGDATAWLPSNSSTSISAWYKSDEGLTYSSSNVVSAWTDQSGNSNDLSVPGGSTAPSARPKQVNNKDVVEFNDSTEKLQAADSASLDITSGISIFAVVLPEIQTTPSERIIVSKGANYKLAIATDGETEYTTSTTDSSTSTVANNVFQILGLVSSNAFYFDGVSGATTSAVNGSANTDPLDIQLKDAYLAELIIYNGTVSSTDREKIEGYLAHKWLTSSRLSSNHPYKLYAPVV